jgi:hypothetical protein
MLAYKIPSSGDGRADCQVAPMFGYQNEILSNIKF